MGAVYDHLNLEIEELRNYLRSDPADDSLISRLFDAAKMEADKICNNSFEDGNGEVNIPPDVEQWVYESTARRYQRRAGGIDSETMNGLGRIDWGELDIRSLLKHRRNPGL